MNRDLSAIRQQYERSSLEEEKTPELPFALFADWFHEVLQAKLSDPTAFFLASTNKAGDVSLRTVLLKSWDTDGFVFFTNYHSHKGSDFEQNPKAAMLFYWDGMERQIRVEGLVEKISAADSDAYYYSRPEDSQIGAIISPQSKIIESRDFLENSFNQFKASNQKISRPNHWGGYLIVPQYFEFWQGRSNRLHDRIAYTKIENNWIKKRLAP